MPDFGSEGFTSTGQLRRPVQPIPQFGSEGFTSTGQLRQPAPAADSETRSSFPLSGGFTDARGFTFPITRAQQPGGASIADTGGFGPPALIDRAQQPGGAVNNSEPLVSFLRQRGVDEAGISSATRFLSEQGTPFETARSALAQPGAFDRVVAMIRQGATLNSALSSLFAPSPVTPASIQPQSGGAQVTAFQIPPSLLRETGLPAARLNQAEQAPMTVPLPPSAGFNQTEQPGAATVGLLPKLSTIPSAPLTETGLPVSRRPIRARRSVKQANFGG